VVLAVIGSLLVLAYSWTQTRYFVGADDDTVVIFQGIQQSIGPIALSTPHEDTEILLADLPSFSRATVERTISARSLADAEAIVDRLRDAAEATR
jgi:protein phosphatase